MGFIKRNWIGLLSLLLGILPAFQVWRTFIVNETPFIPFLKTMFMDGTLDVLAKLGVIALAVVSVGGILGWGVKSAWCLIRCSPPVPADPPGELLVRVRGNRLRSPREMGYVIGSEAQSAIVEIHVQLTSSLPMQFEKVQLQIDQEYFDPLPRTPVDVDAVQGAVRRFPPQLEGDATAALVVSIPPWFAPRGAHVATMWALANGRRWSSPTFNVDIP